MTLQAQFLIFWRMLFLIVALFAAGCSGAPLIGGGGEKAQDEAAAEAPVTEYKLGPGDQLRVIVFGEPDLSGQFVVTDSGSAALPLIGEVNAAGLTLSEFSRAIEARLADGLVRNPRVSAEVLNYRPFFILGEVNKPGTYPFSANLTVPNAVATAGGYTYRADTRRVFIKRAGEAEEQVYKLTPQTMVQPGDTIRIGERLF